MKTKLLKKIRKRFTIEYYPLGVPVINNRKNKKYALLYKSTIVWLGYDKQECLDAMMQWVKDEIEEHEIKQQNKPIEVWYNG